MSEIDPISLLREKLGQLDGPARILTLHRLAQLLQQRFQQTGPGLPQALPDLAEAIDHLSEINGYLEPADAMRGTVAANLGILLAVRRLAYGGAQGGWDTEIRMLRDALTFPNVPPILVPMANLHLAQLYLCRAALEAPQAVVTTSLTPADCTEMLPTDDLDRAEACLHAVLNGEPKTADATAAAEYLLELTDWTRKLRAGPQTGLLGMDLSRLSTLVTKMQDLQNQLRGEFHPDRTVLAVRDPLDRSTPVVEGPAHPEPADHAARRQDPPLVVDQARLREALQAKLMSALTTAATTVDPQPAEPWIWAAESLLPSAEAPPASLADDIVALASMIVEGPAPADPRTAGVDWFNFAAALRIRDRADPGGDGADRLSGCDCLLTAARTIPLDHPAAMVILRCLGAFLEGTRARGGLPDAVAEGFADRIDSMMAAGRVRQAADRATLHALRCLCRADDEGAGRRAVAAMPRDYPWIEVVRAVEQSMRAGPSACVV